jgi:hypothetical protein
MSFSFKPNPKQQVINKASRLFGKTSKIEVTGSRTTPQSYHVECNVNGQFLASANHKNWRKAYNLLVIEVERAYENKVLYASQAQ